MPIDADIRFMRMALDAAREGLALGEMPIGALLVRDNQIISKRYCDEKNFGLTGHAELLAILESDASHPSFKERKETVLYTTLEPCLMCAGAAMSYFLSRIVYSLRAPSDGASTVLHSFQAKDSSFENYQTPVMVGEVLTEEAKALMLEYTKVSSSPARIRYALGVAEAN